MNTRETLNRVTSAFFGAHWPGAGNDNAWPCWVEYRHHSSGTYNTFCGEIPNHDLRGCYALFADSDLVYVGLGASRGEGRYEKHGIGNRLMKHVVSWDRKYPARPGPERRYILQERWSQCGVNSIYTIGLPQNIDYLACALEMFLITKTQPRENRVGNQRR